MPKLNDIRILLLPCITALLLAWAVNLHAAEDSAPLVTIGNDTYTAADFKGWWKLWKEKGMKVPQEPTQYVDWLLFQQAAKDLGLDLDPQYRYRNQTYLKVLSIVQLKQDAIDSKINTDDETLLAYYNEKWKTKWLLDVILFKDNAGAEKAYSELQSGNLRLEDLVKQAGDKVKQSQPKAKHGSNKVDVADFKKSSADDADMLLGIQRNVVKYPYNMEEKWKEYLHSMDIGSYSPPFVWQDATIILHLIEKTPADPEEFEQKKAEVRYKYTKDRGSFLTNELIKQLIKKFDVVIDEDRIAKMDLSSPDAKYSDEPVLTLGDNVITEKELAAKYKHEIERSKLYGFYIGDEQYELRKLINGIIGQTLIDMEALDRHYERTSPIKDLVQFHDANSLVSMVENQLKERVGTISKDEIESYYNANIQLFTVPEVYSMAVISGPQDKLRRIWFQYVQKGDVLQEAETILGEKPGIQRYPSNHLDPDIKKIASGLAKGDVSKIFTVAGKDGYYLLYMKDRKPSQTKTLKSVRDEIAGKIMHEKYAAERRQYLDSLKQDTNIRINEDTWAKLRREFSESNEK